jgi:glycosyltransferase involved in cell wall biosynthesis
VKIVVVIPAHNEEKMIAEVVKEVRTVCPHVFVVDDGSSDRTAAAAFGAGAVTLRHSINRGQGAALQTGIAAALQAGAEAIVTFDADGQMLATDIPKLVSPIESGECDVVLGSRFISRSDLPANKIPFLRTLTLKLALVFTQLTTGLKLTDTHNGLRVFSRRAADRVQIKCDRMAHASEILEIIGQEKFNYREVPVTIKYTAYSLKKGQRLSGAFRIIRDLLISSWVK